MQNKTKNKNNKINDRFTTIETRQKQKEEKFQRS